MIQFINRFKISIFLVIFLSLVSTPVSANRKKPDALFFFNLNSNITLNDNPQGGDYIPIPVLFYQKKNLLNIPGQTTIITGGVFNQIAWTSNPDQGWGINAGLASLIGFAGDSIKIDGNRFGEQYDFEGNFYDLNVGLSYKTEYKKLPLEFNLDFTTRYHHFFGQPPNQFYSFMDDYWAISPSLTVNYGIYLPSLPIPYQFKTTLFVRPNFRFADEAWGLSSNPYNKQNPTQIELKIRSKFPLKDKWSLWSDLYAAAVFNADRISSLNRGTNFFWDEFNQLFLRSVRSDQSILMRSQLQYEILPKNKLAARAGAMTSTYQELLVGSKRDQFVYGFMGGFSGRLFKQKLNWGFQYGTAHGVNDTKWIHELGLTFTWLFKP